MLPPNDDSCKPLPSCEVDLETKTIRFFACKDQEAMISAAEKRFALVISQLDARSGLTNRERRALNREANILRRWLDPYPGATRTKDPWLFPEARTPEERRRMLNRVRNPIPTRRKTTNRRAREARRWYREQPPPFGLGTTQTRPDCNPPVVPMEVLKRLRSLREG
jgi:hypothetical protein